MKLDPSQIKSTNWSRHRKRNKKLWKTTRGRITTKEPRSKEDMTELYDNVNKMLDEVL